MLAIDKKRCFLKLRKNADRKRLLCSNVSTFLSMIVAIKYALLLKFKKNPCISIKPSILVTFWVVGGGGEPIILVGNWSTDFVSERTYREEHLNLSKSDLNLNERLIEQLR